MALGFLNELTEPFIAPDFVNQITNVHNQEFLSYNMIAFFLWLQIRLAIQPIELPFPLIV